MRPSCPWWEGAAIGHTRSLCGLERDRRLHFAVDVDARHSHACQLRARDPRFMSERPGRQVGGRISSRGSLEISSFSSPALRPAEDVAGGNDDPCTSKATAARANVMVPWLQVPLTTRNLVGLWMHTHGRGTDDAEGALPAVCQHFAIYTRLKGGKSGRGVKPNNSQCQMQRSKRTTHGDA